MDDIGYVRADAPGVGARVEAGERGGMKVRDRVVEQIARRSALEVPGSVRAESGPAFLTGTPVTRTLPSASVEVRAGHAWVTVEVAVAWPAPVEQIAATVRDRVRSRTTELAAVTVERVDVVAHVVTNDDVIGRRGRVQ